ncbi:MAG: hypothetical protein QOH39_3029 [Verrucomicrobiota bacterium]|jgi:hypothetical protein
MNLDEVRKSFAGVQRNYGLERHSIKSLSRRIFTSRQTVKKMLSGGELEFEARFDAGNNGTTYEFKSAYLDSHREAFVNEIINEISARLKGLDMSEQEIVLTALHGLRAHRSDILTEFSKPSDEDEDDPSVTDEVSKLIGGVGGGAAGAALGGRVGGVPGMVGGAVTGAAVGGKIGQNKDARDVAVAAGLGAGAVAGHQAVKKAGGYKAVGESLINDLGDLRDLAGVRGVGLGGVAEAGKGLGGAVADASGLVRGRLIAALRKALARTAK